MIGILEKASWTLMTLIPALGTINVFLRHNQCVPVVLSTGPPWPNVFAMLAFGICAMIIGIVLMLRG